VRPAGINAEPARVTGDTPEGLAEAPETVLVSTAQGEVDLGVGGIFTKSL